MWILNILSISGKVILTTSANGKVVVQMNTEVELETVAFSKDPQMGYLALGKTHVLLTDILIGVFFLLFLFT